MRPGVRDRVQTESLLLALAAGAAGALLADWLQPLLVALTPAAVVRLAETGIDGGVFETPPRAAVRRPRVPA
ncbi:MAG: hypothetical protein F4X11_01875 [Acidobacteria bacterium]|nr:hypothetical protein [Acidobacteriota bacterium]